MPKPERYEKVYIVTRQDLSPGLQAAQAAHAAFQFAVEHRALATQWQKESNFLVILSVPDEGTLIDFGQMIEKNNIPVTWFMEPDIDNEITAITLAPSPRTVELCQDLPLAMRELMVKPDIRDHGLGMYVSVEDPDKITIHLRGIPDDPE